MLNQPSFNRTSPISDPTCAQPNECRSRAVAAMPREGRLTKPEPFADFGFGQKLASFLPFAATVAASALTLLPVTSRPPFTYRLHSGSMSSLMESRPKGYRAPEIRLA